MLRSGACALSYDLGETGIERDSEEAWTEASLQAARDVEFFGEEHSAGIGRPPQDGLLVVVPGKDAVSIGFEQPLRAQIAPDGEQTVG